MLLDRTREGDYAKDVVNVNRSRGSDKKVKDTKT